MAIVVGVTLAAAQSDRDQAIRLARETLAREMTPASAAAATVTDAATATWPDSSLGCPAAGMLYTPSLVTGYRVLLEVGGATYAVHVGNGRAVMCSSDGLSGAGRKAGEDRSRSAADAIRGLKLAEEARRLLASRLKLAEDQVRIESYRLTMWPDARLGCAATGAIPPPQPTKGFRIQLRAGGRAFEFHSDLSRVIECAPDPS